MIKYLILAGANPHIETETEKDACDMAIKAKKYYGIPELHDAAC